MNQLKRIVSAAAAAALMFGTAAALPQEVSSQVFTSVSASAADITINATSVKLYAMSSSYDEYLSIPSTLKKKFQLKVTGTSNVSYALKSGDSVDVSSTGLITPKENVWYWYGSIGYSYKLSGQEPDYVERNYNFGKSVITVTAGGKTFDVTVELIDYASYYADQKIDEYISKNVKSTMTAKEKVEQACKMAASYDYSPYASSATGMIATGGGDCWASTDLIIQFCRKLGYDAWSRNGNKDAGAGSGHMNAMVYAGGKYYEAEAGFTGTAPRYYSVTERTSLYSYTNTDGGIEIYQYDGKSFPLTMKIPSTVDGKKVVSIGDRFMYYASTTTEKIVVPEGVKNIGNYAFYHCEKLRSIEIPSTVTSIGTGALGFNNNITEIKIASGNKNYTAQDGVVYNKNKTKLISCPAANKPSIPSTVKTIGTCAFEENYNLRELTLPSGVTEIEEAAFYGCGFLETVSLPGTLKTIGRGAFYECSSLYNLIVPSSVTTMEEYSYGVESDGNYERAIYSKSGTAAANYANTYDITFRTSKSISACTVSIPYFQYTYTGSAIKPTVTVKDGTKTLKKGTDYTVEYQCNTETGFADIFVKGKGSYTGLRVKRFVIKPKKTKITSTSIINGSGIKVKWQQVEGVSGYEIQYSKDKDFSTYYTAWQYYDTNYINLTSKPKTGETWYVKVRGFITAGNNFDRMPYGNFSDVKAVTVTNDISAFNTTIPYSSYTYTGKAIQPTVTVKNGDSKLVKGTDYTVSYKNNTAVGVATITVTGKGNYTGKTTKTFVVKPAKNKIVSLTSSKANCFTLKWTKATAGSVGYEVVYSKNKSFSSGVYTWTTTNLSDTSENFSKVPKSGETWYVKVRSFYTKDGKATSTKYGNYSDALSVKVK